MRSLHYQDGELKSARMVAKERETPFPISRPFEYVFEVGDEGYELASDFIGATSDPKVVGKIPFCLGELFEYYWDQFKRDHGKLNMEIIQEAKEQ